MIIGPCSKRLASGVKYVGVSFTDEVTEQELCWLLFSAPQVRLSQEFNDICGCRVPTLFGIAFLRPHTSSAKSQALEFRQRNDVAAAGSFHTK